VLAAKKVKKYQKSRPENFQKFQTSPKNSIKVSKNTNWTF
jgi:hypothetical protein